MNWWIVLCLVLLTFSLFWRPRESFQSLRKVQVLRQGEPLEWNLEVVETPEAISRGLMYRTELPANTGMLFVFPTEGPRGFWMRNTLVPLDMLFLKEDGRIATIHANTKTESDTTYNSTEPARYVIEVPGGTAQREGIRLGDFVRL